MKSTELVTYRKSHKLSQYDIADMLKVSRGAVAHWEKAEELPVRAALWLQKKLREETSDLCMKVFDHAVKEENKTSKVEPIPKPGAKPFPLGRTGMVVQEVIPNSGFVEVKGATDEDFLPETRNVSPLLNMDNPQLAAAVKEVVEKSLFDQKMDALQLDARIDTFVEKLREAVVDAVKGILGV